jgi:CelD/BcsL family acetyltransferase involved in cellulose biosynthesis
MTLRVETVTTNAGFARLERDWTRLAGASSALGPFRGFSWSYEWWRALGAGRELRLVVASDGRERVGILPLFEERTHGLRRLRLIASAGGGADYLDALAPTHEACAALVRYAVDELSPDAISLEDLDESSPTLAVVGALHAGRGAMRQEPRYPCPYVPIGGTWRDFLASASRRDNLRRREKWFAAQPGFEVSCETRPEAVGGFLARFHRLHAARWTEDGGTQAFPDARLVRFHERIAERFADEGRLRLWTLWVASMPVAVAYAFDDAGRSLYYQSGFDPAWGHRSPGLVLLARFLEDAFDRGLREVDFLRGAEPYKRDWARAERRTTSLHWLLTPAAIAADGAGRSFVKSRSLLVKTLPVQARRGLERFVRARRMVLR